jgi:hypothetical protein
VALKPLKPSKQRKKDKRHQEPEQVRVSAVGHLFNNGM